MKKTNKNIADSFKIISSPKADAIESPKVSETNFRFKTNSNFSKWKEKMEKEKELGGNFRQKAEQAGVPPEQVKDFKYWLRENNESR